LIKSKLTQKLKHANSILEYFEYFCQMSYNFELYLFKVDAFFWDTVYMHDVDC